MIPNETIAKAINDTMVKVRDCGEFNPEEIKGAGFALLSVVNILSDAGCHMNNEDVVDLTDIAVALLLTL